MMDSLIVTAASWIEKPTCHLRWLGSTLQQAWEITHYRGAQPVNLETQWRDVPTEPKP